MDAGNAVDSYAIRRLNPFRGVMQVIECDEGKALSCYGVVWEILVRAMRGSTEWGSLNRNSKKHTYYRFGLWSKSEGLLKRSNSPSPEQDYYELASRCEKLIEYIDERQHRLPFDLRDDHELWLFDSNNEYPIALLAAITKQAELPSPEPKYWTASLGANGVPSQRRFPETRELEAQVKQRAGFNIKKHWVRRQPDGSGHIESLQRHLQAEDFPPLLLNEHWHDAEQQRRADDYIRWITPSLLTLQNLDRTTRARLEQNLNVQAVSIEHHWHLFPEVIDDKLLKAARVQSKIEQNC